MNSNAVHEALLAASVIVRHGWCRGSLARDGKGRVTDVDSSKAVKFCPAGAIMKVCQGRPDLCVDVRKAFLRYTGYNAHEWNDAFAKNGRQCAEKLKEIADLVLAEDFAQKS